MRVTALMYEPQKENRGIILDLPGTGLITRYACFYSSASLRLVTGGVVETMMGRI